ncbi:transporter substrate-binding domain-containing protein [Bacillus aerolatus]|uniref:histidine kinase n=1 Tax=Bacillus aerolatus TaxID=2653354 RepID=A0A6I1FBX2_9BACI|nr:transporter substrate-binding domain-containing protein [Bacillus aerolatus]KAB7704739.1 transporter substrate-binding domain-containing protein [Bacillus aerolatus]
MFFSVRLFLILICLPVLAVSFPAPAAANLVDSPSKQLDKPPAKKVYRIAGEKHLPPFSYINKKGKFTGFSVELFNYISKEEGVEFQFYPMNLYEATRALKSGKIDAIMGLKYSAEQSERFQFSEPYFTMTDALVVPKEEPGEVKSLTDLRGKTIVMQEEPVAFDLLLNVRQVEFQLALNAKDGLDFLFMERADALLTNKWTADFYLEQAGEKANYRLLEHIGVPSDFAVAVRPGEKELLSLINDSLARMQANGEYQILYAQWFGLNPDGRLKEMRNWIIFLLVIIGCALIVLIFIYLWNKRLKKEVAKRTFALAQANSQLEIQQHAISEANAFKTQIIHHMYYGILTFNESLQLTSLNERAKEMLALEGKEQVQTADVLKLPLIARIIDNYETFRESKGEPQLISEEVELELKGETRFILYRLIPLYEEQGKRNGCLLTLADRSEAKMLEKKLATQEKMRALGQLVAGVAHEIRNPLTSMKTFIDLLPRKYEDPEFRQELIKYVPEALRRMNTIVESLLDYSRPKLPQKKRLEASSFIQSVTAIIEPTVKKKSVHLRLEVEPGLKLICDPDQLKQVMLNLLLNALDSMETTMKKQLIIKAGKREDRAVIKFVDTGAGMEKEDVSHIFEPFYTTKPHGVGLGLTLCYQWIKENNGDMQIETVKGKGTTFTVILPAGKKEGT